MIGRSVLASGVLASVIVISGRVSGFPSSRFVYARGEGAELCPDEAQVRLAVAARLGYDPFFPSAEKTIVAPEEIDTALPISTCDGFYNCI